MKAKITKDMIAAMKSKETLKLSVLRAVKTAITNQEKVHKVENLSDDLVLNIIKKQVKQRQDSEMMYIKGGRVELAKKEFEEIKILETYLPEQMEISEVEKIVGYFINSLGATSRKDMGAVMKASQKLIGGHFDGKELSQIVMKLLS